MTGIVLVATGILAGLALPGALTRFLGTLLFGVAPLDLASFAVVALLFESRSSRPIQHVSLSDTSPPQNEVLVVTVGAFFHCSVYDGRHFIERLIGAREASTP